MVRTEWKAAFAWARNLEQRFFDCDSIQFCAMDHQDSNNCQIADGETFFIFLIILIWVLQINSKYIFETPVNFANWKDKTFFPYFHYFVFNCDTRDDELSCDQLLFIRKRTKSRTATEYVSFKHRPAFVRTWKSATKLSVWKNKD